MWWYFLWSFEERILLPTRLPALWLSAICCQGLICSRHSTLPTVSCFSGPSSQQYPSPFWPTLPTVSYLSDSHSQQYLASLAHPPRSILLICHTLHTVSYLFGILLLWHTLRTVSYPSGLPSPQYPVPLAHPPYSILSNWLTLPTVSWFFGPKAPLYPASLHWSILFTSFEDYSKYSGRVFGRYFFCVMKSSYERFNSRFSESNTRTIKE